MLLAGPPAVEPGVLGSLIVAGLAVATFFLLRSMAKQLRKINFEEKDDEGGAAKGKASGPAKGKASGSAVPGEHGGAGGGARPGVEGDVPDASPGPAPGASPGDRETRS